MGKFYIETSSSSVASGQKVIYELSATTDIRVKNGSKLTQYPAENGQSLVDNIVVDSSIISLSGIITDVSFSDVVKYQDGVPVGNGAEAVEKYIEQINARIKNREVFTFYFSNVLKPLRNCVITSFEYSKDNTLGGESWKVSISAQQVRFARRAQFVQEPAVVWKELTEKNKQGSGNKSNVSDKSKEEIAFTKCMGTNTCQLAPTEQYPRGEIVSYDEWKVRRKQYFDNKNKTVKKG